MARKLDGRKVAILAADMVDQVVSIDDYDALIVPGAVGNPDQLRGYENAVNFARGFAAGKKAMGVICDGPWILVEAGVIRGRKLTSWPMRSSSTRVS